MMLFDVLQKVADELPGCELTSIVSLDSGLSLACVAPGRDDAAAGADAFHSELYRVIRNALSELGNDAPVDGVVVQGKQRVFVSRPVGGLGYFWHVATRAETTLGFTQAVMRKYQSDVESGLRELLQS